MAKNIGMAATMAGVVAAQTAMGSCTIKADPQKIISAANNLKKKIDKLQYEFNSMIDTVNATGNYWQGVAADSYRNEFKEERPEFDEAFKRMSEHVADLQAIAAEYIKGESVATDIAESLLDSVID